MGNKNGRRFLSAIWMQLFNYGFFTDHLKDQLEQYMQRFPKVRIVRASVRVGLIKARMMGARAATGKILTFLDSHIEATTGGYVST